MDSTPIGPSSSVAMNPVMLQPMKNFYLGEPLALGYIISGSLSVAAARNPKMSLVKGMLAMNVVSAVAAAIGTVIFTYSVHWDFRRSEDSLLETSAVLLAFVVLEFCIAICTAAFGCKTVCRDSYTETLVVVYQNMTPANAVGLPAACKDPESP